LGRRALTDSHQLDIKAATGSNAGLACGYWRSVSQHGWLLRSLAGLETEVWNLAAREQVVQDQLRGLPVLRAQAIRCWVRLTD